MRLQRAALIVTYSVALALGSVGITDEGYGSSGGDMPRYLMNGAYILDLLGDRPVAGWSQLLEYTRLYYARYPALSLGHHPVLLPLLEAPIFAVLGISVFAGRLIPLVSLLVAVGFLHALVKRRYGAAAGITAAALFATSPMIVTHSRMVMAEVPSIAMVLASAYWLQRFIETERRSALVGCTTAFILSLYTKPLALLVAPALLLGALAGLPLKRLLKRDVLLAVASVVVLGAPAVAIPLVLSRANMSGVILVTPLGSRVGFSSIVWAALKPQLAWPVLATAVLAVGRAIITRDSRSVLFLFWIASVTPGLYFFGGLREEAARYTVYWVPAFCALAGSMVAGWRTPRVPLLITACLATGLTWQVSMRHKMGVDIPQAGGYEQAAQFVLGANPGTTVLVSGDVDSGYFPFFVRKHDAERRLIVLRADKIFTTSRMWRPAAQDRISSPEEIYPILQRYGTRYVVLEDRPSQSRVLEWLRQELKSARFTERQRIPIRSSDWRLRGTSLAIYEFRDWTPPDPNAVLTLHMPLVGQSLSVTLRDLIDQKFFR